MSVKEEATSLGGRILVEIENKMIPGYCLEKRSDFGVTLICERKRHAAMNCAQQEAVETVAQRCRSRDITGPYHLMVSNEPFFYKDCARVMASGSQPCIEIFIFHHLVVKLRDKIVRRNYAFNQIRNHREKRIFMPLVVAIARDSGAEAYQQFVTSSMACILYYGSKKNSVGEELSMVIALFLEGFQGIIVAHTNEHSIC